MEAADSPSITQAEELPDLSQANPYNELASPTSDPRDKDSTKKLYTEGRIRRFPTILNLLNSLLGAGILGVPGAMRHTGLIPSVIVLALMAVISEITTILTLKLQNRTNAAGLDELAAKVLGRGGSVTLSILSMAFCISGLVAYLVIASDSILSWFRLGGIYIDKGLYRALIVLVYSLLVPVPLTIPRKMTLLSHFSWVNFVCVLFFVVVSIYKAATIIPSSGINPDVEYAKFGVGIFRSIAIFGFAFSLPVVVLPVISSYNKDVTKRVKASIAAMCLCFSIVCTSGIFGYLVQGPEAGDNVLLSYPDDDVLIIICRICFFFVVNVAYAHVCRTTLASWSELIYKENDQSILPAKRRGLILVLSNAIPVLIALVLPNAGPALSIGGALGGGMVAFFFPSLMWLVMSKKRVYHPKNIFILVIAVFGIVSAGISTYLSIVDAISAFK